jgi:GNAT superfamily N-acetyltransferase
MSDRHGIRIRPARPGDEGVLRPLQERASLAIGSRHYGRPAVEAYLREFGSFDAGLIADRTYFVAELDGETAGCGGWSFRPHAFGSGDGDAAPKRRRPWRDPAVLRAFFVEPRFARRGVGRALVLAAEDAARSAGFRRGELTATLAGAPLYRSLGWSDVEIGAIATRSGPVLPVIHMAKAL